MADKPSNITATLKSLAAEAGDPDPFKISLSDSKVVTFPDPLAMDPDEAEIFIEELQTRKPSYVLAKWLPAEDVEAIRAQKLNYRQQRHLLQSVVRYYEGGLADAGEGPGSAR
ncbi:hypothetical protein [Tersicoccus sp. Bi-70]|uniref:hypothetical protein n=1 Tax=Tersicoccus sp. Bi-70 TaxID=1897634 RepID=UPI000976EDE3|nr:hypothetical protein [Tersicoccus sp. Bi-70]OMH30655.1 hypothetical protein BGP79_11900 [Tersicoccus sp. Bi-70]